MPLHPIDLLDPVDLDSDLNWGLKSWNLGLENLHGTSGGRGVYYNLLGNLHGTFQGNPGWALDQNNFGCPTFVSASSQFIEYANLDPFIIGASRVTAAGWINRTAATHAGWCRGSSSNDRFGAVWYTDNTIYCIVGTGVGQAQGSFAAGSISGWHHVIMMFDGTKSTNATRCRLWLDGVERTLSFTNTIPATVSSGGSTWALGRTHDGSATRYATGPHSDFRVYIGRDWTDCDTQELYDESLNSYPTALRRKRGRITVPLGSSQAPAAYNLTADAGSFALTGQIANLLTGRKLACATGSFILSGQDANLLKGYPLTAAVGTFTLTGQAAGLRKTNILVSSVGTYTLSGQPANLKKGFVLNCAAGAYVWSGKDANLIYTPLGGYTLTAEKGTFTLSGQSTNLLYGRKVVGGTGSYSLSGQNAGLTMQRKLVSAVGSFVLTGQNADLRATKVLNCVTGTFVHTGQAASLKTAKVLNSAVGSFSLGGQNASLKVGKVLVSAVGSYTLSGQAANLRQTSILVAATGTFSLSGQTANLLYGHSLVFGTGVFVLTGRNAELVYSGAGGAASVFTTPVFHSRIFGQG